MTKRYQATTPDGRWHHMLDEADLRSLPEGTLVYEFEDDASRGISRLTKSSTVPYKEPSYPYVNCRNPDQKFCTHKRCQELDRLEKEAKTLTPVQMLERIEALEALVVRLYEERETR